MPFAFDAQFQISFKIILLLQAPNSSDDEEIKPQIKDKLQMAVRKCNSDSSGKLGLIISKWFLYNYGWIILCSQQEERSKIPQLFTGHKALDSLNRYSTIKNIFKRYIVLICWFGS